MAKVKTMVAAASLVVGLGAAFSSVASATTFTACGGASDGTRLIRAGGFSSIDFPSISKLLAQRAVSAPLAQETVVPNTACGGGHMVGFGSRRRPKGYPMGVMLPANFSKADLCSHKGRGCKAEKVWAFAFVQELCGNGTHKLVRVVIIVKKVVTVKKPKPKPPAKKPVQKPQGNCNGNSNNNGNGSAGNCNVNICVGQEVCNSTPPPNQPPTPQPPPNQTPPPSPPSVSVNFVQEIDASNGTSTFTMPTCGQVMAPSGDSLSITFHVNHGSYGTDGSGTATYNTTATGSSQSFCPTYTSPTEGGLQDQVTMTVLDNKTRLSSSAKSNLFDIVTPTPNP
jgi:hypothetical protein